MALPPGGRRGRSILAVAAPLLFLLNAHSAAADEKSPVLAGVLSAVLPGSGQLYAGDAARGGAFFLGEAVLIGAFAASLSSEVNSDLSCGLGGFGGGPASPCTHSGSNSRTNALFYLEAGVHIWDIIDAVGAANRYNRPHVARTALAADRWRLSLVPGFGHAPQRQLRISLARRF